MLQLQCFGHKKFPNDSNNVFRLLFPLSPDCLSPSTIYNISIKSNHETTSFNLMMMHCLSRVFLLSVLHSGPPGALTATLLTLNKTEGDGVSEVSVKCVR